MQDGVRRSSRHLNSYSPTRTQDTAKRRGQSGVGTQVGWLRFWTLVGSGGVLPPHRRAGFRTRPMRTWREGLACDWWIIAAQRLEIDTACYSDRAGQLKRRQRPALRQLARRIPLPASIKRTFSRPRPHTKPRDRGARHIYSLDTVPVRIAMPPRLASKPWWLHSAKPCHGKA